MSHLYECSKCGEAVKVISQGEGVEPIKKFKCGHDDAVIYANRKVTLRGKGDLNHNSPVVKIRLTVKQLLCALTGKNL